MSKLAIYRDFLKAHLWEEWEGLKPPQVRNEPKPAEQKPYPPDARLVDLVAPEQWQITSVPLLEILKKRRSLRRYASEPLSLPELSFLLWATQGVSGPNPQFRTAPSAGGRHPFETYIAALSVADLPIGLYRYLPLQHKLLPLREKADLAAEVATACYNQPFITGSAVVFMWTAVPMRTEWRYSIISHKMIAIDAGHVCQNLYLAAESIGAGACAIGKYHQERMDQFLGVTGETEFAIYAAAVGKR